MQGGGRRRKEGAQGGGGEVWGIRGGESRKLQCSYMLEGHQT